LPRVLASREARGYGQPHRAVRSELEPIVLAGGVRCWRCGEYIRPGEPWDLGHVDGDKTRYAGPEHRACNRTAPRRWVAPPPEPEPERLGLGADDARWDVPWLKGLRRPPRDAVWPRYMSVPHVKAVGSLGSEFVRWAEGREGLPLRWWQRLVATRLLEVDAKGELVWETLVLSMARQLGKSWLLRELCLWRIHESERFGEPQDVVHTGKDLQVCQEVQRPARAWAKADPAYKVREVNGQESIEFLPGRSRWMLRAKEAAYGLSVSVAAVDEAWKVKASTLDESVVPTMVARVQPQLWLISTAHRLATSLMLSRRQVALAQLEDGDGDLLVEWSAPKSAALEDVQAWKLASPHWTAQRQRLIQKQLDAVRSGDWLDPDEPDPEQSFRAQWLNQWPAGIVPASVGEPLLPAGLWADLAESGLASSSPLFVAMEDDFGNGAAVAACAPLDDGRFEVDGWLCRDWDSAVLDVQRLGALRPIRQLLVGASLLNRLPFEFMAVPSGSRETRVGLPLLRDLALGGVLVHDETTVELDQAVGQAQVRELSTGLELVRVGPAHLVKALAWAVHAAHKPAPTPAVF
jgi:hypothetical protein